MKDLPRSWFSNGRPLPLDSNGKLDFSLDVKKSNHDAQAFDPTKAERFMGRLFDQLAMPDGGRIIRLYRWGDNDPELSLDTNNHNIFRLDSNNEIIWQIQRVEDRFVNWESRNKHAKERDPDCEGYHDPFIRMGLQFFESRPLPYKGPFHPTIEIVMFDDYAPGRLLGAATRWWAYDIDPESGIATCTGEQVK